MDKLKRLIEMLSEQPEDSFLLFALAKEYEKSDSERALHYYEQLRKADPDYLGLYYHHGQLLIDLNRDEQAENVLQKGLQLARTQQDNKTAGELQQLLMTLE
jgi:tetratricopeptide (TPR) repeat protein